jgi:hypothetical protein
MVARPTGILDAQGLEQLQTWANQQQQVAANQATHDAYLGACSNYVVQYNGQLAAKQPLPEAPVMPMQTVYNDDGTISHPPFPDLTQITPPAAPPAPTQTIANPNPPMDRTDALILLVQQVLSELDAIKAALAIK